MIKRITGILLAAALLAAVCIPSVGAADDAQPEVSQQPAEQTVHNAQDAENPAALTKTASSNDEIIYAFLTQTMGLNSAAACGLIANFYYESGYRPDVYGDGGTSYGICQWHDTRFKQLKNWCVASGYDYTTLDGQLHFLQYDLKYSYRNILDTISAVENSAQGAYDAAYYWCKRYEVPADTEIKSVRRGNYAMNMVWQRFGTGVKYEISAQMQQTGKTQAEPQQEQSGPKEKYKSLLSNYRVHASVDKTAYMVGDMVRIAAEATQGYTSLRLGIDRVTPTDAQELFYSARCDSGSTKLRFEQPGVYFCTFTAVYPKQTVLSNTVVFEVMDHDWQPRLVRPATSSHNGLMVYECADCSKIKTQIVRYPESDALGCASECFEDVDSSRWYHAGIDFAVANGLFNGASKTEFAPDVQMTRAMMITVLWRLAGQPEPESDAPFDDVAPDDFYAQAVAWAAENGIATGVDEGGFHPDDALTRQQMATFFCRYAALCDVSVESEGTLDAYPDADQTADYALAALQWSVEQGLISGVADDSQTLLEPDQICTRAQAATVFLRYANRFA